MKFSSKTSMHSKIIYLYHTHTHVSNNNNGSARSLTFLYYYYIREFYIYNRLEMKYQLFTWNSEIHGK